MIKLRWRLLFLVLCATVPLLTVAWAEQDLPTAKPEEVGVCPEKVRELSTFMQSLVDQGKIAGGVTMMARHGKVIHLEAVGMADREEKKPMRTDSIFRIASMTKPITSVAIMMLWEQGKLGLDDPVSKYIPEFENVEVLVNVDPLKTEPAKREITIRHLLTHTSGLGYTPTPGVGPIYVENGITTGLCRSDVPLEQMIAKLARLPLRFQPGERFLYGMSTDVLGRVVEVVSGTTLDRFIEDRICHPLGMTDTSFKVPSDKLARLASAYVPDQDGQIRKLRPGEMRVLLDTPVSSDYPYVDTHKFFSGGGGLCSTPADYMRFCQMLLNRGQLEDTRLLREDTIKMMTTNQLGSSPNRFGFGFGVMPETDDIHRQLRGTYSWGGYWSTLFRIAPHGNWTVITMSQVAWQKEVTPTWFANFEKKAAEAILK